MASNFIDYTKIYICSGKGGTGSSYLLREKFNARGGPAGGDGGRGGHIIVKGNRNLWTLLHLKYTKHIRAGIGENGVKNNCSGAEGEDKIIEVPIGTIVKDSETGEILAEVMEDKQKIILIKGGKGGKGNSHFKTPTNQTPRYSQPGLEGKHTIEFKFEPKSIELGSRLSVIGYLLFFVGISFFSYKEYKNINNK